MTKSPKVSKGSKRARTAYTSSQLFEMEQEFRNNNYLSRPRRISLATLLNLSERQVKTWLQDWKKRKKETLNDGEITGTAKSNVTSMSRRDDFMSSIRLHAGTLAIPWAFQVRLVGYQCLMCPVSVIFLYMAFNFDIALVKILQHTHGQK
jgi:hypothetical protein